MVGAVTSLDPASAALPAPAAVLARLVAGYVASRPGWADAKEAVPTVLDASVLVDGRPGLVDVVAEVAGRTVHVAFGLRALGDEAHFFPGLGDPVLGLYEDDRGLAVAFDATADEVTATALLEAVAGVPANTSWARRQPPAAASVGVAFDDRVGLLVFDELSERTRQWSRWVEALDAAGFCHLPAPVAFWRRRQYELGMVRELLPGAVPGRALALESLRNLLDAGCDPDKADGDFAGAAEQLGSMTAQLHLAFDRAFGRRPADVMAWSATVAAAVRSGAPHLAERADVRRVLDDLVSLAVPCFSVCSHGDLHLDRVGMTDEGWYLAEVGADGNQSWVGEPVGTWRSPLADVADMLWSFGEVAGLAVAEYVGVATARPDGAHGAGVGGVAGGADMTDGAGIGAAVPSGADTVPVSRGQGAIADDVARQRYLAARRLADTWERRNRRAFIGGYLGVPGIAGLVPPARHALRTLTSAFELEQSVRRSGRRAVPRGSADPAYRS